MQLRAFGSQLLARASARIPWEKRSARRGPGFAASRSTGIPDGK
jgi:hypothetical protein